MTITGEMVQLTLQSKNMLSDQIGFLLSSCQNIISALHFVFRINSAEILAAEVQMCFSCGTIIFSVNN